MENNTSMLYFTKLFLEHSYIRNKKSTYTNYQYIVKKHIIPFWNNINVNDINNELILEFIDELSKRGLKNKTIKDILLVLKGIFKISNISIKIPMPKVNKPNIKIFNDEDKELLEKELLNDINYINFSIYLSLYTGIRIGELCALKFSDIDFYKRTININQTITRVYDKDTNKTKIIFDSPKTYTSTREIPIPPFLMKYLRQLKYKDEDYILTGDKKYMQPRTLNYKYNKILKKIDLDNYTFHSLRHTFATQCINSGANIKTLSLILGHKSVEITLNRYVHPSIEEKYKIMNNLKPSNEKLYNFKTLKNKVIHLFKR